MAVTAPQIAEHRYFRPEGTVPAFFRALGDRDADAAGKLLTLVPGSVGRELLRDPVLKAAGYTPPEDATVRVSFGLGGQRYEQSLHLVRDSESTAGLFHRWHLAGRLRRG